MTESKLATAVVAWLGTLSWDVYQEVEGRCGVADIVAVEAGDPRRTWIIEVKTSLSLAVLAQAWHWLHHGSAHRVSVAVPMTKNWKARTFTETVARKFGIGILYVSGDIVSERVSPDQQKPRCLIKVCAEHKSHAKAGTSRGGYWTTFKGTCAAASAFVRENPGCTPRQMVAGIKHHYSTDKGARSSLLKWAKAGKVDGVHVDDGKLWPDGKEAP